jgi:hypothetical protein
MIAPIREADPPSQGRSRTSGEVRRLVASLFLDEAVEENRPVPPISRWKAWLLIGWAAVITLIYFAAMLDLV